MNPHVFVGDVSGHIAERLEEIIIVDEDGNPIKEEVGGEYGKRFSPIPKTIQQIPRYIIKEEELVPEYAGSPILIPKSEIRKH